jgi:succinylglutamate desuccinylase
MSQLILERIIGRYTGSEDGPLVICFGAIHGNEPAGVLALERLFSMLGEEVVKNPSFKFKGRLLGILGNKQAYSKGVRYVDVDLNRQFGTENVAIVRDKSIPSFLLTAEDLELKEVLDVIAKEIKNHPPERIIVLDLHTTSADGGIFSIIGHDLEGLHIAQGLHAPVVMGLVNGIGGTSLHYFNTQNMGGIPTTAISFEAGQHDDSLSADRAIAVIVNCMRMVGCVRQEDVENKHDAILKAYSAHLPSLVRVLYRHPVLAGDGFKMLSGFKNFQALKKGELLAADHSGDIVAPSDCLLLMPLYQSKGSDGFFLVVRC